MKTIEIDKQQYDSLLHSPFMSQIMPASDGIEKGDELELTCRIGGSSKILNRTVKRVSKRRGTMRVRRYNS